MESAKAYCIAILCLFVPISLIGFYEEPIYENEEKEDDIMKKFALREIGTQDIVVSESPYVYKTISQIQTIYDIDNNNKWYCWTELFVELVGATLTIQKVMIYAAKSIDKDYSHEYSYEYTPSETLEYGGTPYIPFQMKLYIKDSDGATSFDVGFVFMYIVNDSGTYYANFDFVDLTIYADGVTSKDVSTKTIQVPEAGSGLNDFYTEPFSIIDVIYDTVAELWYVLWACYNNTATDYINYHTLAIVSETDSVVSSSNDLWASCWISNGYFDPVTEYYYYAVFDNTDLDAVKVYKVRNASCSLDKTINLPSSFATELFSKTYSINAGKYYLNTDFEAILTNYQAFIYNKTITDYDFLDYPTKGIDPSFGNELLTFSSESSVNKYLTYNLFCFARKLYKFKTAGAYWEIISYRDTDPETTSIYLMGDVINILGTIYDFVTMNYEPDGIQITEEYLKASNCQLINTEMGYNYIELYDDSDNLVFLGKSEKGFDYDGTQYKTDYESLNLQELTDEVTYSFSGETVSGIIQEVLGDCKYLEEGSITTTTATFSPIFTNMPRNKIFQWCDKAENKITTIEPDGTVNWTDGISESATLTSEDPESSIRISEIRPGIYTAIGGIINGSRTTTQVVNDINGYYYTTFATFITDETELATYLAKIVAAESQTSLHYKFKAYAPSNLYNIGSIINVTDTKFSEITELDLFIMGRTIYPLLDFTIEYICYDKIQYPKDSKESLQEERAVVLEQNVENIDATTVKNTGNETIAGVKTFSSDPVLPSGVGIEQFLGIGSGNAIWYPAVFHTGNTVGKYVWTGSGIGNVDGTDYNQPWGVPIPLNRGGLKFYATAMRITLSDADADDYVDALQLYGQNAGSSVALATENTNRTTVATHTTTFGSPIDCSSYNSLLFWVVLICTTGGEVEVSAVELEGYYA